MNISAHTQHLPITHTVEGVDDSTRRVVKLMDRLMDNLWKIANAIYTQGCPQPYPRAYSHFAHTDYDL